MTANDSLEKSAPPQVLLVDDDPFVLEVCEDLLRHLGCQVETCANGVNALQVLEQKRFDVLLLDIQMPEMDGLEVARRIRQRHVKSNRLRIVGLTASKSPEDQARCLAAGMDGCLEKPLNLNAVQAALPGLQSYPESHLAVELPPQIASAPALPAFTTSQSERLAALVDVTRLWQLADDQPESVVEVVQLYLSQTAERMQQLRHAISNQAAPEVRYLAHKSLGASVTCGVHGLEAPLVELEQMGESGNLTGAAATYEKAHRLFEEIRQLLESVSAGLGHPSACPPSPDCCQEPSGLSPRLPV
jgi:CheY-like chemotaxis protein